MTLTGAVGPAQAAEPGREALRNQFLSLGLILVLASPAFIGVGSSALRLLFPAAAFGIALVMVLSDRTALYASFTLWLFALTPWIRRLVDLDAGYASVNLLMLAPYAAAAISLVALPALLRPGGGIPGRGAALLLFGAVGYGMLLAIVNGRLASGIFDAMRWGFPPAFCVFLLVSRVPLAELKANLESFFGLMLIVTALYGFYQFVAAPAWDGYWMIQSEMNSIGSPEPFKVRVFSTLNSPGSYSFFLLVGLLVMLGARSRLWAPALGLGIAAFALTMVRSSWLAFALGTAVIAVTGPGRARPRVLAIIGAVILATPFALTDPQFGPLLEERLTSLTRLAGDTSAFERANGYNFLAAELDDRPFGAGLAVNGTYASYADGGRSRVIDGGPIEIFLALGVIGGTIYFLALLWFLATAVPTGLTVAGLGGYLAALAALTLLLTSGTTTVGEAGILFWTMIAILILGGSADIRSQVQYS